MSDENKNIDIDFNEIDDLFNLKIEEDDTDIDTEIGRASCRERV